MAEKEISLMRVIGHGLSGLQLVCLLCFEGHVGRTECESRSSHVTAQAAKQERTRNTSYKTKKMNSLHRQIDCP